MGGIKKQRKQYETPRKKWDRQRLDMERKLKASYGLKNKREIRRTETILRKKRQNARNLLALPLEERKKREKELIDSLRAIGVFKGTASLDDVLSLSLEELLERRLESVVWRKNLAKTIKQARQFIVHGHISVNGRKVTRPSCIVRAGEDEKIAYFKKPLQLEPPKKETKKKEGLRQAFEKAAGAEAGEEAGTRPLAAEEAEATAEAVEGKKPAAEVEGKENPAAEARKPRLENLAGAGEKGEKGLGQERLR